jgi:cytochrome c2
VGVRELLGHFDARHHIAVKNASLYWHTVDAIWLAILATFYLSTRLYPGGGAPGGGRGGRGPPGGGGPPPTLALALLGVVMAAAALGSLWLSYTSWQRVEGSPPPDDARLEREAGAREPRAHGLSPAFGRTRFGERMRPVTLIPWFLAAVAAAGCGRAEANPVPGGSVARGEQAYFAMGCAACHTVDGVRGPHGKVGPPLTGIGQRSFLAGRLPNSPENMVRWIMHPQQVEPGTAMPDLHVTEQGARDLAAFLYAH